MTEDSSAQERAIKKATRRILFGETRPDPRIPGAGRSAALRPERHVKVKVTINIDGDIIAHFKKQADEEGQPYQSLINQALKDVVNGSRPERIAELVAGILKTDPEFVSDLSKVVGNK